MAVNPYFKLYTATNEQSLAEGLIIESIAQYGYDVSFLPRKIMNFDPLYGSDAVSEYDTNFTIEMYIGSINGFEGDGTFLSKFNLEIRDQVTLIVSMSRFATEVPSQARPNEGDLIYFPLTGGIFVISYVKNRAIFYQFGALQTYELVCEMWEYSSEKLRTGIPFVDALEPLYSTDTTANTAFDLADHPSTYMENNDFFHVQANTVVDFDESNPFGGL